MRGILTFFGLFLILLVACAQTEQPIEPAVQETQQEATANVTAEYNPQPSPSTTGEKPEELKTGITEEEAKAIALARVPGTVTDIVRETKSGKLTYVVEIRANSGTETDVIIDINTGEILAVET